MLLEPSTLDQVQETLLPEHFYSPANRRIYEACLALAQEGSPIDAVMVGGWLKSRERLAEVGGVPYIARMVDSVPSIANAESYARIIREKWRIRSLISTCQRVAAEGYGDVGQVQNFIDTAEQSIYDLARSPESSTVSPLRDILKLAFAKLEEAGRRGSMVTGFPTGFAKLDEMTSGLHATDLVIVAARPGMGKCLAADAEILLSDGSLATIEEIVRRRSARVLTLDEGARLTTADVGGFVDDGLKPTFRVSTRLGRVIETTLSHPFLTPGGWTPLEHLAPGQRVAVPRVLPVFGEDEASPDEASLLGYLISERGRSLPRFSHADPSLIDDFAASIEALGGAAIRGAWAADRADSSVIHSRVARRAGAATSRRVAPGKRQGSAAPVAPRLLSVEGQPGPSGAALPERLAGWLEDAFAGGEKRVPAAALRLRRGLVARLLSRLFAADGQVSTSPAGRPRLTLRVTGERLARQVAHLLLRFGVVARVRRRGRGHKGAWSLLVTRALSIRVFCDEIGMFGQEQAIARARAAVGRRREPARDICWDQIVAIESTGVKQVYDLTIPGTHNFIANDVCVHNTSLVLNIAINVAAPTTLEDPESGPIEQPGGACAIFSLEMPREQIATRMVCSEARVDVQKVRNARLSPEDWHNLTQAAGFLSSLPIYVDDSPGITVLDVRSKVRRIQAELQRAGAAQGAERKVGLVVIDYLQLMRGSDKAGSREQEISEISRGLKHLAKELKVPVIALSQLNRSVETRGEKSKRPQISDLRECVTGDTLVCLADGRRVPIAGLVGQTPEVLAMGEDGRLMAAHSDKVWSVGKRAVFEVVLASGRRIRATGLHRLYGARGWVRVSQLAVGDRLALARRLPEPVDAPEWPESHLLLLGHLIGDGSFLSHQPLRYTTASEENSEAVAAAAREFGVTVNRHAGRGNWHQLVFSGNGNRWHPAGVNRWLRELGIYNQRSHEKRLPSEVFTLGDRSIATLLRHLWATDGTITPRPAGQRGSSAVNFATCSLGLAHDVASLLLRLGIVARVRRVPQGEARPMYSVAVSGAEAQRAFLDRVGAFGPRRPGAARLRDLLAGVTGNTNVDTVPREVFERVREQMVVQRISQREMVARRGTAYGGTSHFRFAPSRDTLAEYAEILDDDGLRAMATNDLFWDRVVSIEAAGQEEVFDLTVPGPASWLADGIVSHNSGAIEQDADMIMFIYRDDYYNKDTNLKGIAEIIVAKQRNGPTGKAFVRWDSAYTRFQDLQPGEMPEGVNDE
jgi:replicative DNA helicase